MKWYQRFNPFSKRESISNPSSTFVDWLLGGRSQQSYTGKTVNAQTALTLTAFNAGIRIISETIASIPLHVYQKQNKGKRIATEHALYNLIHWQPNSEMTAFSFWEVMLHNMAIYGNCYADIEFDNGGNVIALWPLLPQNMKMERFNGVIRYRYLLPADTGQAGQEQIIANEFIFHVHGPSPNGLYGYNQVQLGKEAIGLGLAVEEFGNRFFGNGGNVSGVLEHPAELGEDGRKNLRDSFEETNSGLTNAHRLLILEEGLKYVQMGIPPDAAQFLETRKFSVNDMARHLRLPPHMLGDLSGSTNNNIEQQSLEFVKYSILPWVVRIEQTARWKLLSEKDKRSYFAKFDLDGLLRGDLLSRTQALHIQRMDGIISANDWLEVENKNAQEGDQGDIYFVPVNWIDASKEPIAQPMKATNPPGGGDTNNA